jgi:hypothetical protein
MKQNQHYIPKFLLKKFTDDKSKGFRVFDKTKESFLSGVKYPKKTMVEKLFYEHNSLKPNEVEDLLSKQETRYSVLINKIINGGDTLTRKDFRTLMEFRHVTHYRSSEFFAFHTHHKNRGDNSWLQRADWRSLNGIYNTDDYEGDMKKSQLNAIKRTIAGTETILKMSLLTPVCVVFELKDKRFVIGDSGSISMGGEFDGVVVIVISPQHALMFPRTLKALEVMKKFNIKNSDPLILYESAPDDVVDIINDRVKEQAYRYWVECS